MSTSEEQSLLERHEAEDFHQNADGASTLVGDTIKPARHFYLFIVLLKVSLSLWTYLVELPLVWVIERAICREYYQTPDIDEASCKLPRIQNKLAYLLGFKLAFDAIPGLLTSISYGSLADRYGRRPILALASAGDAIGLLWVLFTCSSNIRIPVEAIWLGSLGHFAGGGPRVLFATFFTMVTDVVVPSRRSYVIFLLHATAQWSRLFSPIVAATLMERNIWLPFTLAFATVFASLIFTWALPETAPMISRPLCRGPRPAACSNSALSDVPELYDTRSGESVYYLDKHSACARIQTMLQHTGLRIIFMAFVVKRIAFTSENFIDQYTSEKLRRRISKTALVRVSNTAGSLLMTSLILPLISYIWFLRGTQNPGKDLWISRVSCVIAIIGFAILWKAKTFIVVCIGMFVCGASEGLEPALQTIASSIVGKSFNSSLFIFTSVLDTIAELSGGPMIAAVFSIRTELGEPLGFCFLLSMALFAILLFSSWGINLGNSPRIGNLKARRTISLRNGQRF